MTKRATGKVTRLYVATGGMKRRRTLAVVAALALVLTATAAAHGQPRPKEKSDPGVTVLRTCDGGVQKQSLVTTQNSPATIGESLVALPVPGATRTFTTSEEEQVRVMFAAEAVLIGALYDTDPPTDAISVEIRLDGLALPQTGDLGFATGPHAANATLICARVPAGQHTVQVFWQVFDQAPDNVLTGRFDDWAMDVQINN